MFDMLSGQYKNLASKGRYGDTMLAHINPEEAALLQSMGGAGTVNPQTGLPEFYFRYTPPPPEPLAPIDGPSIPQYIIDALPKQLETQTIYTPKGIQGGGFYEKQAVVPPPNAIPITATQSAMGGPREVPTGEYYVPLDMPNYPKTDALGYPVPPLVAKYDASGTLQGITAQTRYAVDENYRVQPEYNTKGQLVATGLVDNREGEGGGFGDFVSSAVKDFAPMIALAAGANLGLSSGLFPGAGAAAAPSVIGPYAAQAAGAYGGSAAAAGAAAAGSLSGIQAASAAQNALNLGIPTGGGTVTPPTPAASGGGYPAAPNGAPPVVPPVAPPVVSTPDISGAMSAGQTPFDIAPEITASNIGQMPDLSSLGSAGSAILKFAKDNPSIAGSLLGAVTSAIGSANAPKAQTTTSSIDPDIKAKYLAYLKDAETASAGLLERKFAPTDPMYTTAETQLNTLGLTPFGATDIKRFFDPYEEKVVTGALGDIERTRLMQEQANRDRALQAKAFGGSRQAVVSGMTNEAALRQAANTAAQLRSSGYTQAANLGLTARPLDIAGLQTSLGLGTARTSLAQQKLDAARNLALERLSITGGALGLQPANTGGTTSQPLYNNTAGSLLSGGLTGAYIGSLLQPRTT